MITVSSMGTQLGEKKMSGLCRCYGLEILDPKAKDLER